MKLPYSAIELQLAIHSIGDEKLEKICSEEEMEK